jgi:stage II sporulation protein AA (anti-sigma F factor antagonist)
MQITTRQEGNLLIITMVGEMDHHNLINVSSRTDPIIKNLRPQVVILDMSGVPFCDSSGIAAVLGRYKIVRSWGGQLMLHGLSPQVRKVLTLGGIFNLIKEVRAS